MPTSVRDNPVYPQKFPQYDEGMESRTVMVPANGVVYKLREELKNDGALLFGLIFLAYLDIGAECFSI